MALTRTKCPLARPCVLLLVSSTHLPALNPFNASVVRGYAGFIQPGDIDIVHLALLHESPLSARSFMRYSGHFT